MQGQDRIQDCAEGIDIGQPAPAAVFSGGLFRRHVFGGAADDAVKRHAGGFAAACRSGRCVRFRNVVEPPCDSPVQHEHFSVFADLNIIGLEVQMNDAAGMGECDGIADFQENIEPDMKREPFLHGGIAAPERVENFRQRNAVNQFHREVRDAAFTAPDVVDWNDVRVFEGCRDARFFEKTQLLLFGSIFGDRHCDVPSDIDVFGFDNDFHSPGSDHMPGVITVVRRYRQLVGRYLIGASDGFCLFRLLSVHSLSFVVPHV